MNIAKYIMGQKDKFREETLIREKRKLMAETNANFKELERQKQLKEINQKKEAIRKELAETKAYNKKVSPSKFDMLKEKFAEGIKRHNEFKAKEAEQIVKKSKKKGKKGKLNTEKLNNINAAPRSVFDLAGSSDDSRYGTSKPSPFNFGGNGKGPFN